MNLDNYASFSDIDRQDMLSQIAGLPNQLEAAWELGHEQDLPAMDDIQQVLIVGMGGSAIGADLLSAYIADKCRLPVLIHRDYDLPAWASGAKTLVIASSHSGNTEETLSAYTQAEQNGCERFAITTGGRLAALAAQAGDPIWQFKHEGQPRAAVGFSFGLLLALFARLKLIPDPDEELEGTVKAMRHQQVEFSPQTLTVNNSAKRLAGQIYGRWITVIGSGILAPVARRWKGQVSEIAKAWAQFEHIPEMDHNTLAGIENPENILTNQMVLFLQSRFNNPANQLRSELTRKALMLGGIGTDTVNAIGDSPLAQQWTCLHYGDYVAYYLAMGYQVDPTPVRAIEDFKRELKDAAN